MFPVAAAAILKLHSRAPTAFAPHPWLSSSLRALAEVLSQTLRSFPEHLQVAQDMWVVVPPRYRSADLTISGSFLGILGWEEALSSGLRPYERQML